MELTGKIKIRVRDKNGKLIKTFTCVTMASMRRIQAQARLKWPDSRIITTRSSSFFNTDV